MMKNKVSRAHRLGTLHIVLGVYSFLFLAACLIIALTGSSWIPQDTEGFEGLGYAFGLVFFIIFGSIGYGMVGTVNAIICLVHGVRLRRATEQKEVGRRSLMACLVCKLVALIVAVATCILCTSMLAEVNLGVALLHTALALVGIVLTVIACVKEIHLWRLPSEETVAEENR